MYANTDEKENSFHVIPDLKIFRMEYIHRYYECPNKIKIE